MKKITCFLSIMLSIHCLATENNDKYYTELKVGCEIMTGLADLSMHHRQTGTSFSNASRAITAEKFIKKSTSNISKKAKKEKGMKLESIYINILKETYKMKIAKKEKVKQKILEDYTTTFYKDCMLTQKRF